MFEIIEKRPFSILAQILMVIAGVISLLALILLATYVSIEELRLFKYYFDSVTDVVIVLVFLFNILLILLIGFWYENNILYTRIDKVRAVGFFDILDIGLKINDKIILFDEILKLEIYPSIGIVKSYLTKEKRCVKVKLTTRNTHKILLIKQLPIDGKNNKLDELFRSLKFGNKNLNKKIFVYI